MCVLEICIADGLEYADNIACIWQTDQERCSRLPFFVGAKRLAFLEANRQPENHTIFGRWRTSPFPGTPPPKRLSGPHTFCGLRAQNTEIAKNKVARVQHPPLSLVRFSDCGMPAETPGNFERKYPHKNIPILPAILEAKRSGKGLEYLEEKMPA